MAKLPNLCINCRHRQLTGGKPFKDCRDCAIVQYAVTKMIANKKPLLNKSLEFTTSNDGVPRCTVIMTLRFTKDEYEKLKFHAEENEFDNVSRWNPSSPISLTS